eukprot:5711830-Amphidinium_carterae.1
MQFRVVRSMQQVAMVKVKVENIDGVDAVGRALSCMCTHISDPMACRLPSCDEVLALQSLFLRFGTAGKSSCIAHVTVVSQHSCRVLRQSHPYR